MFIKDGNEKRKTMNEINELMINSILAKANLLKNL